MCKIDVSVYITTYNHENYLSNALDSVLMQQINFSMEVFVGDDASTDGTALIMHEYENKYPGFFNMIYRDKNISKSEVNNGRDLFMRCKGRYVILLEGDDYWTDPYKLQKQYDFLETHPEYIAVAHNVTVVNQYNEEINEHYPECKHNEYTIEDFLYGVLAGQTATMFIRNYNFMPQIDQSIMKLRIGPGDVRKNYMLLGYGKIWCIQEKMSAYRHIKNFGSSFSATHKFSYEEWSNYYRELMKYALQNKDMPQRNTIVSEILYLETIFSGIKKKYITCREAWHRFNKIEQKKYKVVIEFIKYYILKNYGKHQEIRNVSKDEIGYN